VATTIIYWQQIAQQKAEGKRQELAGPIYERIIPAYQKVIRENNYLVVLKPGAIEFLGSNKVENVFEKVAKELRITLPPELRSASEQQQAPPATNKPATGTGTRPTTTPKKG
jgi:hypothetical protein